MMLLAYLVITNRIPRAKPLNQNPVKVSDLCCNSVISYFSSDAKIPRIIFLLHLKNMRIGLTLDLLTAYVLAN